MSSYINGDRSLRRFAEEKGLELEWIDGVAVAVEDNGDQSLILLEGDTWSSAVAVDIPGLSLAEALEATPEIAETLEFLAKGPVFASDGGGPHA